MKTAIQDEFTNLPISRQRKYQLRMQRDRRCTECGEPTMGGSRCLKHLVEARELQRSRLNLKRRYARTLSYKLEEKAYGGPRARPEAWVGEPALLPTEVPHYSLSNLSPVEEEFFPFPGCCVPPRDLSRSPDSGRPAAPSQRAEAQASRSAAPFLYASAPPVLEDTLSAR